MSKSTTVTAADVRAFFADEAKGQARVEALPEAARTSVRPGARGRLHPDAIKAFNAKRKTDRRYVSGATKAVVQARKDENREVREAAVRLGYVKPGSRGPLPKAALLGIASNTPKPSVEVAKPQA